MEVEVSGAPAEKNFDAKRSDEKYHNATNSTS